MDIGFPLVAVLAKLQDANVLWNWLNEATPMDISFPLVELVHEQMFRLTSVSASMSI